MVYAANLFSVQFSSLPYLWTEDLKQMLCALRMPIQPHDTHGNLFQSTTYIHTYDITWGITWGCTSVGTARGEGHLGLHSTACVPY